MELCHPDGFSSPFRGRSAGVWGSQDVAFPHPHPRAPLEGKGMIVSPPPSRGRPGGGWGSKMSRFPVPTVALPLKASEYSASRDPQQNLEDLFRHAHDSHVISIATDDH